VTTINSLDDFLQALDANPTWREAVRARILGEELLQLPTRFGVFAQEQAAFNDEQRAITAELKAFNEEQKVFNRNNEVRLNRMEGDMGTLKGEYARTRTIQDARGIASDMGLEYVRTLSREDLSRMAGSDLDRATLRSFRNADLVIEASDGVESRYVALEISFTADKRELDRATRNAELIRRFTGKTAQAAIASVRNDRESVDAVESGAVYWHPLEDRTPSPE
jgi:hypothetical protein